MSEPLSIEINGALTRNELARFHYFHLWRKSWKLGLISIVLVVSATLALGNYADEDGVSRIRLVLAAALGAWIAAVVLIPYRSAAKQWAEQPYLRDLFRLIFTPQTIERTSPSISSVIAWSVVQEIYETKTLMLLYIAPNQAIIVPKRFFPDDATIQAWKELAKSETPRFIEDNFLARWF